MNVKSFEDFHNNVNESTDNINEGKLNLDPLAEVWVSYFMGGLYDRWKKDPNKTFSDASAAFNTRMHNYKRSIDAIIIYLNNHGYDLPMDANHEDVFNACVALSKKMD